MRNMGNQWEHDGHMIETWTRNDGTMMEQWWNNDGTMMEQLWNNYGTMMEQWSNDGDMTEYLGRSMMMIDLEHLGPIKTGDGFWQNAGNSETIGIWVSKHPGIVWVHRNAYPWVSERAFEWWSWSDHWEKKTTCLTNTGDPWTKVDANEATILPYP